MWEAQVIAFERGGQGWMMWDWKNEEADEWSYQVGNDFLFLLLYSFFRDSFFSLICRSVPLHFPSSPLALCLMLIIVLIVYFYPSRPV